MQISLVWHLPVLLYLLCHSVPCAGEKLPRLGESLKCAITNNFFLIVIFILPPPVGIFDSKDSESELAFDYAIEMANNEILSPHEATLLSASHLRVINGSDHQMSLRLCRLLKVCRHEVE